MTTRRISLSAAGDYVPQDTKPPPRRGRPRRTDAPGPTRAQVVDAVIRLAEENPNADINMRDLARALGVSPKLLYRHASGKDELIDLAAMAILQTWQLPAATLPWPERLTEIMTSTRALVRRYPSLSEAVLIRNLEASESPDVTRIIDAIKGCFVDAGLSQSEAGDVLFLYEALLLGELSMAKAVREGRLSGSNLPDRDVVDAGFEMGLRYMIAGMVAGRKRR